MMTPMVEWNVEHTSKIGSRPEVTRALIFAGAEMVRDGQHPGDTVVFMPGDSAFYVRIDEKVVGVLVYEYIETGGYVWISLGWVAEEHRRKGIYRAMIAAVDEKARELKADNVSSMVCATNATMREIKERQGYKMVRWTFERKVQP